ncbi:MAG: ABC transporter ATP-binding protein [Clostridia bacterium]|nr:ABC transporter ATP-binding protein [Clostridia bacterium]
MAARTLEELQKQYNGKVPEGKRGMPIHGPRGPMGPRGKQGGKPKNTRATMKRLLSYLSPYKFRLFLVLVCMLLSTVSSLMGAYILRPILNALVGVGKTEVFGMEFDSPMAYLAVVLTVVGAVYLIGVISSYAQARLMLSISLGATEHLRGDLFARVQELPVSVFDGDSNGEIMSRFTNDIDNIDMMLNNTVVSLISGVISLIGTFVMMVTTSIWLTLITVVFVPLFIRLGAMISKRARIHYVGQQAALGALGGYIEESISGQKVIKVFNHEEISVEEFMLLNGDMREKQFRAQFYGGIMGPILGNTSQINYAITAGVGGFLCLGGHFDPGGLAVFVNYSRQFARPIDMISQQMSTIFSALAGAERVFSLMDREPEPADVKDPASTLGLRGEIVLKDVTFGYVPEKTVLKNLSLYAHAGQKIAFVGSTGAGKTTVTNLLSRFYDIQSGQITIDGRDIKSYRLKELRQNIATVLQDTHLFTGTVRENIRYGRLDASDEEVIEAAKTASAHSFIMRLEKGYDTMLEGDGANLSQGQRQLLNIARAALSRAPILVLDEATSSVDTRTERHIERGMDRLMSNRTTFVIAHRLSTVRNANAIMVLEQGEIIERGTHEELLALGGRYYELYTGKKELA